MRARRGQRWTSLTKWKFLERDSRHFGSPRAFRSLEAKGQFNKLLFLYLFSVMPDFTPLPVPTIPENEEHKSAQLSEEEEKKHQDVLAHFDKDDYRLPDEEKGELMDEEKIWLVRLHDLLPSLRMRFLICTAMTVE